MSELKGTKDQQLEEGSVNTLHGNWFTIKEANEQAQVMSLSMVPNLRWDCSRWAPAEV